MTNRLEAADGVRGETSAEILAFRESDQRELWPNWDSLPLRTKLRLTRRAHQEGILTVRARAEGRNKVLLLGIDKLLRGLRDGQSYKLTHLDLGTSSQAPAEGDTGCVTHVDASTGVARVVIVEKTISGKQLRTSSFLQSGEYVGSTLREGCLFDAATGGTAYNRVLFSTPLAKIAGETALANIDHTINN